MGVKRPFLICVAFGCLPALAWFGSLVFSVVISGRPFEWSPVAYAPLFIITLPLKQIYGIITDHGHSESHVAIALYAAVCSLIYFAVALVVMGPVLVARWPSKRSGSNRGIGQGQNRGTGQ